MVFAFFPGPWDTLCSVGLLKYSICCPRSIFVSYSHCPVLFTLLCFVSLSSRNPLPTVFLFFFLSMYVIQHCFICRPSDSTVSEDVGIKSRIDALEARSSNHSARSHPHSTRSRPHSARSHPLNTVQCTICMWKREQPYFTVHNFKIVGESVFNIKSERLNLSQCLKLAADDPTTSIKALLHLW